MVNDALLDHEGRARVAAAVAAAERGTSAELRCVVAADAGPGHAPVLAWGLAAALVAPVLLGAAGLTPLDLPGAGARWLGQWHAAHDGAGPVWHASLAVLALQGLILALFALAARSAALRRVLTPRAWVERRTLAAARRSFHLMAMAATDGRNGVLIHVALAERRVDIVADTAVFEHVDAGEWAGAVKDILDGARRGDLVGGLEAGIAHVGRVLAEAAPPVAGDRNELPNQMVVLDRS